MNGYQPAYSPLGSSSVISPRAFTIADFLSDEEYPSWKFSNAINELIIKASKTFNGSNDDQTS